MIRRSIALAAALLAACRAAPSPAGETRKIGDFAWVEGTEPVCLTGVGIVVGLDGTGDSVGGPLLPRLFRLLPMPEIFVPTIAGRRAALVWVVAEVPPGDGSGVTAKVLAFGDADSLRGGRLLGTEMKELPTCPAIRAHAEGPVEVDADGACTVRNVRIVGKVTPVKRDLKGRSYVTLRLHRQDPVVAEAIVRQLRGARAWDRNGVDVALPPAASLPAFLERVLESRFVLPAGAAIPTVVIDTARRTIVWLGRVMVERGFVGHPDGDVHIGRRMSLDELFPLMCDKFEHQSDVLRMLSAAGLLNARLVSR
ncbi:MAG: flagellar basal body P-ring protein FlgI [Planctomycetes bacterium]|nr:flagellar basal body P-ring protein FlgI [Planctomycetota bacterium]